MTNTINEVTQWLEEIAPPSLQESYDNAGLIIGNKNQKVKGVLITLDVTEDVVKEAISRNANLIIAHHPIIFKGLKKIIGATYVERTVMLALKNDIAIFAAHTNLDHVENGVNGKIAEKLGLINCKILSPKKQILRKLVTYVPENYAEKVKTAIFEAGAGNIGNYDYCSFNTNGIGTFRGNTKTNPFVGKINEIHQEKEIKIETVFYQYNQNKILNALFKQHPYEEVAYDIFELQNQALNIGSGMVGELENEISEIQFLKKLKKTFNAQGIRYTNLQQKPIKKVAFCGGSGSFLLKKAILAQADIFITGDFTYHNFFDAENQIVIADIGHFESEQFTKELFYEIISKKFNNFASYLSLTNTNPINYLQ